MDKIDIVHRLNSITQSHNMWESLSLDREVRCITGGGEFDAYDNPSIKSLQLWLQEQVDNDYTHIDIEDNNINVMLYETESDEEYDKRMIRCKDRIDEQAKRESAADWQEFKRLKDKLGA